MSEEYSAMINSVVSDSCDYTDVMKETLGKLLSKGFNGISPEELQHGLDKVNESLTEERVVTSLFWETKQMLKRELELRKYQKHNGGGEYVVYVPKPIRPRIYATYFRDELPEWSTLSAIGAHQRRLYFGHGDGSTLDIDKEYRKFWNLPSGVFLLQRKYPARHWLAVVWYSNSPVVIGDYKATDAHSIHLACIPNIPQNWVEWRRCLARIKLREVIAELRKAGVWDGAS